MPSYSEIRIVEATTPAQFAAASALFRSYAEELGWDLSQGGRLADEIASPPGPYAPPAGALLLAYADEEPVGVLGLQAIPAEALIHDVDAEKAGELKRLFVCPEFRRCGVGERLMRRSEDVARRLGYDSLVLTTSAEMMPLAQRFYDTLGYCEAEPYRNDMPFPHIRWMKLAL